MKYKYFLIAVLLMKNICSIGQTVTPGTELQEIVKITEAYATIPSLSFDVRYTFADSLTPEDIVDSMLVNYKISNGKSFISNSEFELLYGTEYNVYVDKEDSLIMASPAADYKTVFQIPLMDSLFRANHVSSMRIDESSDSIWVLRVFFNPGSYYLSYDLTYNRFTGLVEQVDYESRNESGDHDIPADHIVSAEIFISNFSEAELDAALFNENRYIYKLNGLLYLQPAWQQYQFQN